MVKSVRKKIVVSYIEKAFPSLSFSEEELSRGANAEIFVMESSNEDKFVLKAIDKKKKKEKDLEGTEVTALKRVKSDFVVPLIDTKEDNRYKFLLFPFIAGKDMEESIRIRARERNPFSNEEISDFAKQMAQAVIDMNNCRVIHQDIKPKNIRVTPEGKFILVDLGIARFKEEGKKGVSRGAYYYSSPEQIRGAFNIEHSPITSSSDLWAIGVIMYEMATFQRPFLDHNSVVRDPVINPQKSNPQLSTELTDIILTLLNKHACDRYPTPEKFKEVLNGRDYQPPKAFNAATLLFSLRRTPMKKDFIIEYRGRITDEKLIPYGALLPARSITKDNSLLVSLKGQNYHLFVDPETYMRGIKGGEATTRKFFSEKNKRELITEETTLQLRSGADYLISPYFCIENIDGNELSLTLTLYKESQNFLEEQGIGLPLFGGLFLARNILANEESRKKVLDELLAAVDGLAGIYLIVETAETGSLPVNDRDLLIGLREFIENLSQKLPVILGYGCVFSLGLIPSGLSGIVSHPYPSARKINIQQIRNIIRRNQRKGKNDGGPPKFPSQFYVPKLLNFIRVNDELDKFIPSSNARNFGDIVVCDCPFCRESKIFQNSLSDPEVLRTSWDIKSRNNHFIYNLASDINEMSQGSPAEARKYFLNKIKMAQSFYAELTRSGAQLHPHSQGDFLKSWEEIFS